MRKIIFILLSGFVSCLFSLTLLCGSVPASDHRPLLLIGDLLIDGNGGVPLKDAAILIQGETIKKIGPSHMKAPANTRKIVLKGAAILPGFINAHVHRAYDSKKLQAWCKAGVTTVRDLGTLSAADTFELRDRLNKSKDCARLVAAGPMITTPGGYGALGVTSPDDAREKVNRLIDAGADIIKIAIEDDLQRRKWPMLPMAEIKTIIDTAHKRGLPVSAHISHSKQLEMAIKAGVDDVAHMIYNPLPRHLVEKMVDQKIYWVPTMELWNCVETVHKNGWLRVVIANLRKYVAGGGLVAMGTDYAGYICDFELGMPMTEITLMKKAGMTTNQIITACTKHAAAVCNMSAKIGTLEAGKIADILVVKGNPLENLEHLKQVRMVIRSGYIVYKD